MIVAYYPKADTIAMWYYNGNMTLMYTETYPGRHSGWFPANPSFRTSLTQVRNNKTNVMEILEDTGDE